MNKKVAAQIECDDLVVNCHAMLLSSMPMIVFVSGLTQTTSEAAQGSYLVLYQTDHPHRIEDVPGVSFSQEVMPCTITSALRP
jgi:hypothetical protein